MCIYGMPYQEREVIFMNDDFSLEFLDDFPDFEDEQKKELLRKTLFQIETLCDLFSDNSCSEFAMYVYYHKIVSIIEFSCYLGILSDVIRDYLLIDTVDLSVSDTVDHIFSWVNVAKGVYGFI